MTESGDDFAHVTTAQLSWIVQYYHLDLIIIFHAKELVLEQYASWQSSDHMHIPRNTWTICDMDLSYGNKQKSTLAITYMLGQQSYTGKTTNSFRQVYRDGGV